MEPSIRKILQNDFIAYPVGMLPIALWLLFFVVDYMPAWLSGQPATPNPDVILLLVGATLLSGLLVAWRIYTIRYLFANGTPVEGVIEDVYFFGSRGTLEVSYLCNGAPLKARYRVLKNRLTQALASGARIGLITDPDDPSKVLYKKLYV